MEPSIPIRSGVYRKRNYIVFGLESSSLDPVTFSFPASSHCGPNTGACKTGHVVAVSGALRRWASESAGTRVRPSDVSIRVQLDHGPLEFFFFFFRADYSSGRLFVFTDGDRWIEDVSREPKIGLRYFSLRGSFISSKDFKVLSCGVSGLLETYWI